MLRFGNKEFRNLQEQVLKNMQNIQDIMDGTTVLAEFGIKVIGQVDDAEDLPDPAEYEGEYGDAYIVGTEEPYEYYIFTRAFEGDETPQWFDLGIFPVPGPQGETGPQGPVGPQGPEGNPGSAGASAGFGTITATAQTLVPGSTATATVVASGPDTQKSFAFTFGIPRGEDGSSDIEWGDIGGTLADQTDLQTALNAKADDADVVHLAGAETITGDKTFIAPLIISENNNSVRLSSPSQATLKVHGFNALPALQIGDYNSSQHHGQVTINGDGEITCLEDDFGVTAYLQLPAQGTSSQRATLATLSDIPSVTDFVTMSGVQTITGNKTITGLTIFNNMAYFNDGFALDSTNIFGTQDAGVINVQYGTTPSVSSYLQIPEKGTSASPATIAVVSDIPTAVSDLQNDSGYITGITSGDVTTALGYTPVNPSSLATVATTGDYDDLLNKPVIPVVNYPVTDVQVDGTSVLSGTVAEITLPAAVSGTNDGTNWTTLTIGADTYGLAGGGSAPSNMATTDTAQTISGAKTFTTDITLQAGTYIQGQVTGETAKDIIGMFSSTHSTHPKDLFIGDGTSASAPKIWLYAPEVAPHADNTTDLGDGSHAIKNAYIKGNISNGTNSIAVANIADKTNSETWTFTLSDGTTVTKTVVLG